MSHEKFAWNKFGPLCGPRSGELQGLLNAVDSIMKQYAVNTVAVVADAGMLSKANQEALKQRNIPYILGLRPKSMPKKLQSEVLDRKKYSYFDVSAETEEKISYQEIRMGEDRIIITHSPKRAKRDENMRNKRIVQLRKKLTRSKCPSSLSGKQYSALLKFAPGGKAELDEGKVQRAKQWDGIHGIIAYGLDEHNASRLLSQYGQLWRIEHCFRINKHDLRIRPIYHWTERRVHAHLAICFMAFCCVQHLHKRLRMLGWGMSTETVRQELLALQFSLLYQENNPEKKFVLPSRCTVKSKRIYKSLNLSWNEVPFALNQTLTPSDKTVASSSSA